MLVRAAAVDRVAEQWREDGRPLQWVEVHHPTTPGARATRTHALRKAALPGIERGGGGWVLPSGEASAVALRDEPVAR